MTGYFLGWVRTKAVILGKSDLSMSVMRDKFPTMQCCFEFIINPSEHGVHYIIPHLETFNQSKNNFMKLVGFRHSG